MCGLMTTIFFISCFDGILLCLTVLDGVLCPKTHMDGSCNPPFSLSSRVVTQGHMTMTLPVLSGDGKVDDRYVRDDGGSRG